MEKVLEVDMTVDHKYLSWRNNDKQVTLFVYMKR